MTEGRARAAQVAFTKVYEQDLWGLAKLEREPDKEHLAAGLVNDIVRERGIRSIVEFGCGFWSYQTALDLTGVTYVGYDVAPSVINLDRDRYTAANVAFELFEDGSTLKPADLLLSKDVLQHLPLADVHYYLALFSKRYPLILLINDIAPEENLNGDIAYGDHRALRLDLPPFGVRHEMLGEWDAPAFGIPFRKRACLIHGLGP